MTRLAIIFSLLFVTPAWAEIKAMKCDAYIYKYETGFWGDKCYMRDFGRWDAMADVKASDWSCITDKYQIIDFISKTHTIWTQTQGKLDWACKDVELPG